jgi:hypothetical protein
VSHPAASKSMQQRKGTLLIVARALCPSACGEDTMVSFAMKSGSLLNRA